MSGGSQDWPWPGLGLERVSLSTNVDVAVVSGGRSDAAPVIFLHGFPESSFTWRYQLSALGERFRVIAPNQRGYFGSDKPDGVAAYAPARLVEDVIALADALGLERFHLVGHDWGGAVAWATALRHAERVEKLVIMNAPHPHVFQRVLFTDRAQRAASQYIRQFRSHGLPQRLRADGLDGFIEAFVAANASRRSHAHVVRAQYLREWSEAGTLEAMLRWYVASPIVVPDEAGQVAGAARPAWLDEPFPRIAVPVLVLWGMQDPILLPVLLEGLEDLVARLEIVSLDVGHFPSWEAPDAVNGALARFLA